MKTPSVGIKILNIVAVISGFIGMLMAVKIPGTVSLLPIGIGLILGLISLFTTKKQQVRCAGCYLAVSLATIGIFVSVLIQLTTEPEVAIDKNFNQENEKIDEEIVEGEELDNLLEDEF